MDFTTQADFKENWNFNKVNLTIEETIIKLEKKSNIKRGEKGQKVKMQVPARWLAGITVKLLWKRGMQVKAIKVVPLVAHVTCNHLLTIIWLAAYAVQNASLSQSLYKSNH
jgi:hypothetical protein